MAFPKASYVAIVCLGLLVCLRIQWFDVASFEGHSSRDTKTITSPDGAITATLGDDDAITLSAQTTGSLHRLLGQKGILCLSFSPDGKTLAAGGLDNSLWPWDVPSVNFLGAVDDGTGKWAKGFWHDALHPNAAGHAELVRTFVPTLLPMFAPAVTVSGRRADTAVRRGPGGASLVERESAMLRTASAPARACGRDWRWRPSTRWTTTHSAGSTGVSAAMPSAGMAIVRIVGR